MLRIAVVALALWLGAGSAAAQSMRAFTTFRQLHGETRLEAHLDYRAGGLRIAPGRATELYRMDASYDENRYLPTSDFNAARGVVSLGLRPAGEGGLRVVSQRQLRQDANVAFAPGVDLDLDITLGAVDADLELGGLSLSRLAMQAGASQAVIRFSQPNRSRCRAAEVTAGAAEVTMLGLGNSRCDRIDFEGGVGKVTLDFDGAWTSSARATVRMAVGELTLRLPRRVGVRLTLDRFLASFDPAGLVRAGNAFQSPGYDRAERRLDIDVTTAVGGVRVEWEDGRSRKE
jgi:Cell wall-active antibiotics response 4TMS YvqF